MPLLEVVLTQEYQNQVSINRWNYVAAGTPAAVSFSFALTSALGAIYDNIALPPAYPPNTLIQRIAYMQHTSCRFVSLAVRNIYSVTDFFESPFVPSLTGLAGGEAMSPVLAYGFTTNRVRTDIRRGQKRFVGCVEGAVGSGGSIDVSGGSGVANLANAMSQVLSYDDSGQVLTFSPAIVGKEKYPVLGDGGALTGRFAYRYYTTETEQMNHVATSVQWTPKAQVRTQTSRQYGAGI